MVMTLKLTQNSWNTPEKTKKLALRSLWFSTFFWRKAKSQRTPKRERHAFNLHLLPGNLSYSTETSTQQKLPASEQKQIRNILLLNLLKHLCGWHWKLCFLPWMPQRCMQTLVYCELWFFEPILKFTIELIMFLTWSFHGALNDC